MLSPAAIGPALTTAKGVYDNIVTLKSPEDDDAMSAYEALLRHAGEDLVAGADVGEPARPSLRAEDLHLHGGPDPSRSLKALQRLKDVGLAAVVLWGETAGDHDNLENRWRHRL